MLNMKNKYRILFKKYMEKIKIYPVLLKANVTQDSFSRFMNGNDSVISEEKLYTVYLKTKETLEELNQLSLDPEVIKRRSLKDITQIYEDNYKGIDGIVLDEKRKEIRCIGGYIIFQRKDVYEVGFRNSGINQKKLDILTSKHEVVVHYDNTSQEITLNVDKCTKVNGRNIKNPTKGYYMCTGLDDDEAVSVFNFIKDNE